LAAATIKFSGLSAKVRLSKNQTPTRKTLGRLIVTYQGPPLKWRDLALTFLPATLAALTPWIYGQWRVQQAQERYGPVAAQNWGWPWFGLAIVALIPLLWLALLRVRRAHRIVHMYAYGLVVQGTRGQNQTIYWDATNGIAETSVQEKFLGIALRGRHEATLYPFQGKPVKLASQLPHCKELCARIKGKIYPRLLRELRVSFTFGEELYFGPIHFNQEQVTIQGKQFSWEQIASIQPQIGRLVVKIYNQRKKVIPIRKIPNFELFIQLIKEGVKV
jgi:hypothetical protein